MESTHLVEMASPSQNSATFKEQKRKGKRKIKMVIASPLSTGLCNIFTTPSQLVHN